MIKSLEIIPEGFPCAFKSLRPGFFLFGNSLCFKANYYSTREDGVVLSDCYCEEGSYFWGGVATREERDELIVQPVIAVWRLREAGGYFEEVRQ